MTATDDARTDEIRRNRAALVAELPELLKEQKGRYALMKGERVVGMFSTAGDAVTAGSLLFADGLFSAHKVTDQVDNIL